MNKPERATYEEQQLRRAIAVRIAKRIKISDELMEKREAFNRARVELERAMDVAVHLGLVG